MIVTPEKKTAFCAALAETGIVALACKAVDIARQTAYRWREEDPDFAKNWDNALQIGITALEDEAARRAFRGVDEPLVHQGQFTPIFVDELDADGKVVMKDPLFVGDKPQPSRIPLIVNGVQQFQTMKKYSDTLAIFLLKAHAPERFRENSHLTVEGHIDIADRLVAARKRNGR